MRDYMNAECIDCRVLRRIETLEAALAQVCPSCHVKRGIEDYRDWCYALDVGYDAESAEEYLYVTNYGASLPDWAQAKVRAFAEGVMA